MKLLPRVTVGIVALLVAVPAPLPANGEDDTDAAADFLTQYAETDRFRLGRPTAIHPTADGREVLFGARRHARPSEGCGASTSIRVASACCSKPMHCWAMR